MADRADGQTPAPPPTLGIVDGEPADQMGVYQRVFVVPIRGKSVPLIRNQRVLCRGCRAGHRIKRPLVEQRRRLDGHRIRWRLRKPLMISRGETKQQGGIGFDLDRRRKRSRRRRQELQLRGAVSDGHRRRCRRPDTGAMKRLR